MLLLCMILLVSIMSCCRLQLDWMSLAGGHTLHSVLAGTNVHYRTKALPVQR